MRLFEKLKTVEGLWSLWYLVLEQLVKFGVIAAAIAMLTGIGTALYSAGGWINGFGMAGWVLAIVAAIIISAVLVGSVAWAIEHFRAVRTPRTAAPGPEELAAAAAATAATEAAEAAAAKAAQIRVDNAERDLSALLTLAVYESAVFMLDDLLQSAPEGFPEGSLRVDSNLAGTHAAAEAFLATVRDKMDPGLDRRRRFESVMDGAQHDGEHCVESTPMEQRPLGVDPLALRRHAISYQQCVAAIGFLRRERRHAAKLLLSQRPGLLVRNGIRHPPR